MYRNSLHLGELVWRTAGDLSHSEESQLRLQILQLVLQLDLRFVPKLVNLNPRFCIGKQPKINKEKMEKKNQIYTDSITK